MKTPLSEQARWRNIEELTRFRRYWRHSSEYPQENLANDHIYMPVGVSYSWGGEQASVRFRSIFRAYVGSGLKDGAIELDETVKIKVEEFHLSFTPSFQRYRYDLKSKVLLIKGSSAKMSGEYKVLIKPTISQP